MVFHAIPCRRRGSHTVKAIIGQLYPATLLVRLVTLELEHRQRS
jgi:hypothetical protein